MTSAIKRASLCVVLSLSAFGALSAQDGVRRIRNVVLVHGAWVDGSGWKGVYDILVKHGYNVTIVPEPLTTFREDVTAVKRILDLQEAADGKRFPSDLARSTAIKKTVDGFTYLDPAQFHE